MLCRISDEGMNGSGSLIWSQAPSESKVASPDGLVSGVVGGFDTRHRRIIWSSCVESGEFVTPCVECGGENEFIFDFLLSAVAFIYYCFTTGGFVWEDRWCWSLGFYHLLLLSFSHYVCDLMSSLGKRVFKVTLLPVEQLSKKTHKSS